MADTSQKTEKPTQKRLKKARSEGRFASSKDLISALQFMVFLALLATFSAGWFSGLKHATASAIQGAFRSDLTATQVVELFSQLMRQLIVPTALTGCILVATGLGFQLASTRGGIALQRLAPSFQHFNPISKLKSLPGQGLINVLQAILLLVIFGLGILFLIQKNADSLLLMPLGSLEAGLKTALSLTSDLLWKAAAVFIFFGMVDFFRQTRRFTREMRMTKQEVRDELKESEVNPQIKMRIRRLQRDLRRRKMINEVATATAVIVNPTHYAVAIRYKHESMATPQVVAKGKNYLALRIRQKAMEHQVPLIENPPLAQALYRSVKVGQEIPPHLYRAVAEILAYIYKLMGVKF